MADVLVSPRLRGRNTPSKIYAYLRAGKAIVATDIVAHTQTLSSDTALLVPADPDPLAAAILSVLDNPELGKQLGTRARTAFDTRYEARALVGKTADVIRLALARNTRA